MGTVVIKCNVIGKDFSVGIETDEFSFNALPDLRLKSRCPFCGSEHEWTPRQARLRRDPWLRYADVELGGTEPPVKN